MLKNKHQAVSQGVRHFGKRSPPEADEHLQKPHNAGSRREAQFFNTLLVDDDAVDNPVGISRPAVFQGKGDGPAIVG